MDSDGIVDIIIVGAGASGCIIASRLAAADPTLKILILESGPHTFDEPAVKTPGRYLENLVPGAAPRTSFIMSEPSEHILDRQTAVPTGHCVGGGTAINFMMYTRPVASDLDDWEVEYGNSGWGFKSILPMFMKYETFEPKVEASTHGYGGPIHVSLGTPSPISQQWIDVVAAYDQSLTFVDDHNDFSASNVYFNWPKWFDGQGIRQDVAHRFLYPALKANGGNNNLTLRVCCTVDRVIFDGDRAVGVQYHDESRDSETENTSSPTIARAKTLVVLAAGALGSPLILERSGIGSLEVLAAAGVQVKVALEGVGENYQDHNLMAAAYISAPGVTADRDAYLRGDPKVLQAAAAQYERDGSGPFGNNAIDAGARIRLRTKDDAKAAGLNDAFLENWAYFGDKTDKSMMLTAIFAGITLPNGLPEGDYFSTLALTAYPFSKGSVHIRSTDPQDPPVFIPGFLSHPADVSTLMWQYKWTRERARRLPAYRGELVPTHPKFSPNSDAACSTQHTGPVQIDAPDIAYTAEDDKILETWVRQTTQTTWHSLGTCAMKAVDKGGVVDSHLNVYGIRGLKIADLSIPPGNVGSNTASVAMAIGEKAAVIIANELGISL